MRPAIILGPPWWRCENGCEFRSGQSKPKRRPICGSTKIEMVTEVEREINQGPGEHYYVPSSLGCGVFGCGLSAQEHPEIPRHNFYN